MPGYETCAYLAISPKTFYPQQAKEPWLCARGTDANQKRNRLPRIHTQSTFRSNNGVSTPGTRLPDAEPRLPVLQNRYCKLE
jgi:hypothetical protein